LNNVRKKNISLPKFVTYRMIIVRF
jgi:hypothetical protein